MPHISLTLYKGRDKEELEHIACSLQQCLMDTVGWKAEAISISLEEATPEEFDSLVRRKTTNEKIVITSDHLK